MSSVMMPLRLLAAATVLIACTAGAFARTDASQLDADLLFNEKFFGIISSGFDEDVVRIEDVIGSKLTLTAQRDGANGLKPNVDLLDASFAVINTNGFKVKTSTSASIQGFPLPATGVYHVRVTTDNGLTGTFALSIKGKPKSKFTYPPGMVSVVGEIDSVKFVARAGSSLSGSVKRVSGNLSPLVVELVSPSGTLVPISGKGKLKLNASGTTMTLNGIKLPALGEYELRFTGQAGSTGGWDTKLEVQAPKPVSGSVFEGDHPDPDDGGSKITLKEVLFARGLRSADGDSLDLATPFSVVQTDPVTDLPVPGTLAPLFPGIAIDQPLAFNLNEFYAPPIVPRNAVLVLRFNKSVDKASLKLDGDNLLTASSPLQVAVNGQFVAFEVFKQGSQLVLNPIVGDTVGMPASPVVLDTAGNPVASATGAGLISIASGQTGLKADDGAFYQPRKDLLGSPDAGGQPIGFNPGNQVLDFFKQSTSGGAVKTYTGFLPDEFAPRIVRELRIDGEFTPNYAQPELGDIQGSKVFSIVLDHALDTDLKGGKGEYAGGVVRLRPAGPNREQHVINFHTVTPLSGGLFRNEFNLASKIKIPLAAGEDYAIARAEYYEPDPTDPIDPATFDPDSPEIGNNAVLTNFLEVLDRDGEVQDIENPIDPKSTLTMRFSEPMLLESFRPYESFFVTDDPPAANFGINRLGRIIATDRGKTITFEPSREIQFGPGAGTNEFVGFGPTPSALLFHVISVPSSPVLLSLLGEAGFAQFVREGHRGVSDLGGQPLTIPSGVISSTQAFADFSIPFTTSADATLPDLGAIVHRFLGQPGTGSDVDGNTGLTYGDMLNPDLVGPKGNLYGPKIADLNLFTNGFLSGAPVSFFQKVFDDFNPPPTGSAAPFPQGTSTPIGAFSVLGGSKLQHVYRAVDCSPDYQALQGTLLDLYHIAYAPFGGLVTNTVLPDVSIHAGHSAAVPDTSQNQGIPNFPTSGLSEEAPEHKMGGHFTTLGNPATAYVKGSYNAVLKSTGEVLRRQVVSGSLKPGQTEDFYNGKPFAIDAKSLFKPPGSPSRTYHPLPTQVFDAPFPYNNGDQDVQNFLGAVTWGEQNKPRRQSMVLEYRVRVTNVNNPPATQNGFTFCLGVLSSALPRFRIFTIGVGCTTCCNNTAGNCAFTCSVSTGPPLNSPVAGAGGSPLDPDTIINAIGPDVAAPGLTCTCIAPPSNKLPCPPGSGTDVTTNNPNVFTAATGAGTPPATNNFGDNSRYYMLFNYVKRESKIRSPFVRAQPTTTVLNPVYLEPIFEPKLSSLPVGTSFNVKFRASTDGAGQTGDVTAFVNPEDIATLNGGSRPFIQFEATSIGNTSSQLVPVFEEIVIPFKKSP